MNSGTIRRPKIIRSVRADCQPKTAASAIRGPIATVPTQAWTERSRGARAKLSQ
jgi:hypothetical protein